MAHLERSATSQIKLTSSQQQVYEHMRAMVEIYLENPVRNGVRLRLNPLIIGQTGVGKSQIARKLGDDMGLKVIRCTIGDWVVSGANTKPNTMNTIQKAIRQDGCKLLVIDELDKLGSLHSAWSQALLVEVYNLIDRTVSTGDWSKSDLDRLNEEVAIVGAGTWAALWGRRTVQPVGFGSASAGREQSIEALVRRESIVPSELLNRFASPPLILEPYTVADFEEIAATLKLDPAVFDPVSAAASGLNFRAVESALGADAIRKFLAKKRPIPELQP